MAEETERTAGGPHFTCLESLDVSKCAVQPAGSAGITVSVLLVFFPGWLQQFGQHLIDLSEAIFSRQFPERLIRVFGHGSTGRQTPHALLLPPPERHQMRCFAPVGTQSRGQVLDLCVRQHICEPLQLPDRHFPSAIRLAGNTAGNLSAIPGSAGAHSPERALGSSGTHLHVPEYQYLL